MAIGTVINYCTNDFRFLRRCLEEVRHFSREIFVVVCDHLFNGEAESRELLDATYASFPECSFIEFAYSPKELYFPWIPYSPGDDEWNHLWHSTSRIIGALFLRDEIEYALFLDADEIPDGKRFAQWQETGAYREYAGLSFVSYFYVMSARTRAKKLQEGPLLVRRDGFPLLVHAKERQGTFFGLPHPKRGIMRGVDQSPLFHHYSWVRTEEECYRKVSSWAHRNERDWREIVRKTFAREVQYFQSTHEFEQIGEIFFDPLGEETIPSRRAGASRVITVTRRDITQLLVSSFL